MSDIIIENLQSLMKSVSITDKMNVSFSQLGEDRILWWMFHQRYNGFYVDIGCHKPYRFSNTALLYLANGWRGINVDIDERSIAAFNEARPNDVNICAAVGGNVTKLEATIFEHGEFNTLDPNIGAHPSLSNLFKERRMVDVLPLRDILEAHVPDGQVIDFMNVDIEGLDHVALTSNDWDRFLPEVVAAELRGFDMANPMDNPTVQFLISKGYKFLAHLVSTTIFRRDIA